MSTIEILHSITDAIAAYEAKPGLERRIKELEDDLAYAQLENEELKRRLAEQAETIASRNNTIAVLESDSATLKNDYEVVVNENKTLQSDLKTAEVISENRLQDWHTATQTINLQKAHIADLEQRLYDSRSYSERLAETLKSIGASIVSAVAVPEVTSTQPFPVSESVAMPASTDASEHGSDSAMDSPVMAKPAGQDLVESKPETKTEETSLRGMYL